MRRANLISGILLCAFGLAAIFWIIPVYSGESSGYGMSPQLLPTVAMTVVTALSVMLVLQSVIDGGSDAPPITGANWATLAVGSCIVLFGVLLIDLGGMWAGGPVLILALMIYMGERRWLLLALTPVVMVGGVHLLMGRLLGMALP